MLALLKGIAALGISIVVVFLLSFGAAPHEAVAPERMPPAIISAPEKQATSTEEALPAEEPAEEPEPPQEEPEAPQESTEDPLQGVIEAFSKLSQETVSPETNSLNEEVRGAVVNILCSTTQGGSLNPISASGVIIDPRGLILTNAHVAQYLLLEDYLTESFIECVARTGSPAKPKYRLELAFISPSWVIENAEKIDDEEPRGNGEHDYALLIIAEPIHESIAIPTSFPYLPLSLENPESGENVLVAGYPAGFLGGVTIQKELYAASAHATVGQLYTYEGETVDLFSIGGSIVAQHGSSGGAVARENGSLAGLIVTSSEGETTASRDLRALSSPYIIQDFEEESGIPLASYLGGNILHQALIFRSGVAPTLSKLLIEVLEN